ncbi:helix-turn-helix transcriptional regulator [Flagellimonas sp. 389]|uniref:helix-turn-helix domain-containing protein n=1 Tax=Flagellimonas sp. 389 TaxID=2835862 RepID=UPI001BD344F7|nr:AraC family transcriptional regulator [Flagellimonas sp. 389]MBS9464297.1 helix-turn-helix transcriptional regulator [Flagellimonas sp. 389]
METKRRRAKRELQKIAGHIEGELVKEKDIYQLTLDEGQGAVKCINFDDGLFIIEYDVNLDRDVYIPLVSEDDKSIYFLYCLEGNCFYATQRNNHFVKLNELQTAIINISGGFSGGLVLKARSSVSLNCLRVDVDTYFKKHDKNTTVIAQRFKNFLNELNKKSHLVHIGKLNLELADYVKKLSKARYADNLSEMLYFEGLCILILASHIEQYKSKSDGNINPTKLIKRELVQIMKTAEYIQNNTEQQFTITNLCVKSSLSAAKLQEGFKFLYQRTVSDYIRNTRLEKAEELLRSTDMNISEVVYAVGLTSRSYFCKIFKQKFKCSPRDFKTKNNVGLIPHKLNEL